MAEVGEHDEARELLNQVADRSDQNPMEFAFAEVVLAARRGDAGMAQKRWDDAEQTSPIPNDRRWRMVARTARADGVA